MSEKPDITGEAFDFKPADAQDALREHFTDYLFSAYGDHIDLIERYFEMHSLQIQFKAAMLLKLRDVSPSVYSRNVIDYSRELLTWVADFQPERRDALLITHARAPAVIDPVAGNTVSDEILGCIILDLAEMDARFESIYQVFNAIMSDSTREKVAAYLQS